MHDKVVNISPPPAVVNRAGSTVPRGLRRYLSLDDFEPTARRRLPKFLYDYIAAGVETGAALRDNRHAFEQYGFVPRVLNDVSNREQTTKLFGRSYAAPFGIPPMGLSALCAYRGDVVLTRAAAAMNVREHNVRNGFQVPLAITPRVAWDSSPIRIGCSSPGRAR